MALLLGHWQRGEIKLRGGGGGGNVRKNEKEKKMKENEREFEIKTLPDPSHNTLS